MRIALFIFIFGSTLAAAPPSCETAVTQGDSTLENCHRQDTQCEALAKEYLKDPLDTWNGCSWGALIIKGQLTIHIGAGVIVMHSTHVTLVPSYRDSERIDMTVTVEQSDHTLKEYVFKDVPVIVRDKIPQATVDLSTPNDPVGVPTIEAVEKGGKRQAAHSYK